MSETFTNLPIAPGSYLPNRSTFNQGDDGAFILFSSDTRGVTGRKIYINTGLVPIFLSLVNTSGADGQAIIRGIIQLRSLAGGLSSSNNLKSAFEHMTLIKNVQVCYKIFQVGKDSKSKAGVYITNIRPAFSNDSSPTGLHNVHFDSGRPFSRIVKSNKDFIGSRQAAINGHHSSVQAAADHLSNEHIEQAQFGGKASFDLFYIPTYLHNELGVWITPTQKTFRIEDAAKELAEILVNTQRYLEKNTGSEETLNWVIEGDGAKLLDKAVAKLPYSKQYKLYKQSFQFVDPSMDLTPLLRNLNTMDAKLHDTPVKINRTGARASMASISRAGNRNAETLRIIGALNKKNYNQSIKGLLDQASHTGKNISNAMAMMNTPMIATFMDIINRTRGTSSW
ncbi:hypothetical protein [Hahella sp. HN01]|uniref:hypothetical protein n=1 Tax=Hahella sp. HN01 TaxID=2847262 RepID=UPI001C1EEFDF|nr:hypothetical protein [Hahella sp. HN01]MBU6952141.1 hypothetical protein [Hahella sp. HN01]